MKNLTKIAAAALVGALGTLASAQERPQPGGQPGGQPNTRANAQVFGGINQTPWFSNAEIRAQARISDEQFKRLNTAYGQAWNNYNKGIGQLGDLSEQDRARRLQELSGGFYKDFGGTMNDVLPQEQRQRFGQLGVQYRGYDAFGDPTITESLRLTEQQRQQFQRYGQDYSTQLGEIYRGVGDDRTGAGRRFNDLRKSMGERINSTLTEEQRGRWRDMVGDPYNFQPFAGSTNPGRPKRPNDR